MTGQTRGRTWRWTTDAKVIWETTVETSLKKYTHTHTHTHTYLINKTVEIAALGSPRHRRLTSSYLEFSIQTSCTHS